MNELELSDEIPESFLQGIKDAMEGRVYPMSVVMSSKSDDYNQGYRDGFNQCLKDQTELGNNLIASIKPDGNPSRDTIMSVQEDIYAAVHKALDEGDTRVKELRVLVDTRNTVISALEKDLRDQSDRLEERIDRLADDKRELTTQLGTSARRINDLNLEAEKSAATINHLDKAARLLQEKLDSGFTNLTTAHKEELAGRDLDVISLKREHAAYVEKTNNEIEQLTLNLESSIKESDAEINHWKRENARLIDERNKNASSLEKEIALREAEIQSLVADRAKLVQKHDESLEQMRVRYEASTAHDANVIKTLYTERQSVQDLYQEERSLVKKAWEALGYNAANGMPSKSLEELIREKDVQIETLQKSRETATFEHADHAAALRTEIDRLNARQEIMEVTIARYKGLQDQSELLARCADAMEREQYSGSGADIPELIAEVRKQSLATK